MTLLPLVQWCCVARGHCVLRHGASFRDSIPWQDCVRLG